MKKIIITRRLLKESEDKASKLFEAKFNGNDELYSQSKLIELSNGNDAILTSLTDKMDEETINKLPSSIKIISNFAVGFGNIDLEAAKKRGIAVTNTPEVLSDATAEIGILINISAGLGNTSASKNNNVIIVRDSTTIEEYSRVSFSGGGHANVQNSFVFLDSPNKNSAITYKLQYKTDSGTLRFNDSSGGSPASTITLMEVLA